MVSISLCQFSPCLPAKELMIPAHTLLAAPQTCLLFTLSQVTLRAGRPLCLHSPSQGGTSSEWIGKLGLPKLGSRAASARECPTAGAESLLP